MPEKTQYICSILHDHDMTIQWKFTILHQKMRFLTSENIMYGTRWLCFKTDEKKLIRLTWCWKGRCHYWKIGKLPRRQLFFYIFKLKHSWGHRRTWGPSRIYIYIYCELHSYPRGVPRSLQPNTAFQRTFIHAGYNQFMPQTHMGWGSPWAGGRACAWAICVAVDGIAGEALQSLVVQSSFWAWKQHCSSEHPKQGHLVWRGEKGIGRSLCSRTFCEGFFNWLPLWHQSHW